MSATHLDCRKLVEGLATARDAHGVDEAQQLVEMLASDDLVEHEVCKRASTMWRGARRSGQRRMPTHMVVTDLTVKVVGLS